MGHHHQRIDLSRNDIVIENLMPVFLDWCLTIANESDTCLHDCADVEMIGEASVDAGDTDTAVWTDTSDHFV